MKIAIQFERRTDGHKFIREYEPDEEVHPVNAVARFIEKYEATCDVVSLHADEDLRIIIQQEADKMAEMKVELADSLKGIWELLSGVLAAK